MRLVFVSGVCGVGKTTVCNYIKNNDLLSNYAIFDIDELENINDYKVNEYKKFYQNSINKAVSLSEEKNILIASCINPTDIENIDIPNIVESIEMVLIICSDEELEKRLMARDKKRNCGNEDFIKGQVDYQNYLLNHKNMYHLIVNNTNSDIEYIANKIVKYLMESSKK